jgi:hypothetical protein
MNISTQPPGSTQQTVGIFPDYDLDKSVIDASSGRTCPVLRRVLQPPLPYNGKVVKV